MDFAIVWHRYSCFQTAQCELDEETLPGVGSLNPVTCMRTGTTTEALPDPWDGGIIHTNHWLLPERCSALTPQIITSHISEGHKQY